MVMYSTVATIGVQGAVRRESEWLVWELCCRSLKTTEGSLAPHLKRGACTRSHHGYGNQPTHNRSKEKTAEYCGTETLGGYCRRRLLDDLAGCKPRADLSDTHFNVVTRLGLGDEDDEAFHAGDTVAFAAGLFDVNLVLFAFFNWLVEGSSTGCFLGTQQIHLASQSFCARAGKRSVGLRAYTLRLTANLPL